MEKTEIIIIGAGVVGLAIAYELSKTRQDIIVLEKNESYGMEISSRNSEVIHAGLYYPNGSLKHRLCIEGNPLIYELCVENGIRHKKCGKIVVAADKEEADKLEKIYANSQNNGVPDMKLIDQNKVKELEPNVKAVAGLYSGSTGIMDAHGLMRFYYDASRRKGVMYGFQNEVIAISRGQDGYTAKTSNGEELGSSVVINASGLNSDKISAMAGFNKYKLYLCKGDYFSVSGGKGMINRLVYPPPEDKGRGLGVHATLDLEGEVRFGPDTEYIDKISYDIDPNKLDKFYKAAIRYFPWVKREKLRPDTSGIRPKLQGPDDGVKDFVIREEAPGFINLIGIESPGLTASLAIAKYVQDLLK